MRTIAVVIITIVAGLRPAPASVGSWTATGPRGGRVNALAIDPLHPSVAWAALAGRVFRSTDGGLHWSDVSPTLPTNKIVASLTVLPLEPTVLLAVVPGQSVYRSTDGGASWTPTFPFAAASLVLGVDPTTPTTVYAGPSNSNLYKSLDAGVTWAVIPFAFGLTNKQYSAVTVDPTAPATLWVGVSTGTTDALFKSIDGGTHWTGMGRGTAGNGPVTVPRIVIDPTPPQTVYAVISRTDFGLFTPNWFTRSSDGGTSWTAAASPATKAADLALGGGQPAALFVSTTTGVFRSDDRGTSWSAQTNGFEGQRLRETTALVADPADAGHLLVGSLLYGVLHSADAGSHWTLADAGLPFVPSPIAIALDPHAPASVLVAYDTAQGGMWGTSDGGATWSPRNLGLETVLAQGVTNLRSVVFDGNTGTAYAGIPNAGLYKSSGGAWTKTSIGISNSVGSVAVDAHDPLALYAPIGVIHASTDGGGSWDGGTWVGASATSVAVATADSLFLLSGTDQGLYRSTDGGHAWSPTPLVPTLTIPTWRVDAFAFDPVDPLVAWVVGSENGYVSPTATQTIPFAQRTVDGGNTWSTPASLAGRFLDAITFDPLDPSRLYAGGIDVMLRSLDGGGTWSAWDTGFAATTDVAGLAIDPSGLRVWAATDAGVSVRDLACRTDADCADADPCTLDACAADVCTHPAAPDGTGCDDGDACTTGDTCRTGTCAGGAPLVCEDCFACTATDGCVPALADACVPATAGRSRVTIADDPMPDRDRLAWSWRGAGGGFGDPTAATGFLLCVFDTHAGAVARVSHARIAPGACGHRCWSANASGFRYRTDGALVDGIQSLKLTARSTGPARIELRGRGATLDTPALPLAQDPSVVVELRRTDAPVCWSATYGSHAYDSASKFSARSD